MWTPSVSSDAKASDSAWPNSMPPWSIDSSRFASGLRSLRWTVKLSGTCSSSSFSARSLSAGTVVSTGGLALRSSSPVPVVAVGSSYSPGSIFSRRPFSAADSSSRRSSEPRLDLLGGDDAVGDQRLGVDLGDRRVVLDLGRHQRLRVGGLVGLVVAEAAVADHVDDDVAAPALAVGHRQPDRAEQASTSSALTWMIGTLKPFAMSAA